MSDPDDPRREISYEQLPGGGGLTRRQGRWLVFLMLVNTVLLASNVVGPQMWAGLRTQWTDWNQRRAAAKQQEQQAVARRQQDKRLLAMQDQWLAHRVPPGTVVYEEDPDAAAKLMLGGRGYTPISVTNVPATLPPLQRPVVAPVPDALKPASGAWLDPLKGLLLLHERRTPDGKPKLICVTVNAAQSFEQVVPNRSVDRFVENRVQVTVQAYEPFAPATVSTDPARMLAWRSHALRLSLPPGARTLIDFPESSSADVPVIARGPHLRMLAGEPDLKDPTHFTIPYELGGVPGVIDGWLRADAIELRPRDGEMGAESSWTLPAIRPTTAPPP